MNPIIIIPARMASTRLPGKPLALIGGIPMIVHVWQKAQESLKHLSKGQVLVACDGEEIASAIQKAGGKAIITDPDLASGSDRIFEALQKWNDDTLDVIVNVQGDMPCLDPHLIKEVLALLHDPKIDIATLAAPITEAGEKEDPAVVKPAIAFESGNNKGRALYFSRAPIPSGSGTLYHHIGIYAYRRAALERFIALPPSPLEQREKLEQLRALEAGMRIEIGIVDTVPLGVDTPETLAMARNRIESQK